VSDQPFIIEISFHGTAPLLPSEVWPDGDAPERITAAEVVKRIELSATTVSEFLDSWCLEDAVEITVLVPLTSRSGASVKGQHDTAEAFAEEDETGAKYDVGEVDFR
jgi:hypothetical protein